MEQVQIDLPKPLKTLSVSCQHIEHKTTCEFHNYECYLAEYLYGFFLKVPECDEHLEPFGSVAEFDAYTFRQGYPCDLRALLGLGYKAFCALIWLHADGDDFTGTLKKYDW